MKFLNKSLWIVFFMLASQLLFAANTDSKVITAEQQQALTPKQVIEKLKQGNQRFINDQGRNFNYAKAMKQSYQGQHPIAIILSCVDSRSIPDIAFNQGLGNIFVARVAGNVVDQNMLGSMEFATKFSGAKAIVVMGHTRCGAVVGACKGVNNPANLKALLQQIMPAVKKVKAQQKAKFDCNSTETINAITKQNVIQQLNNILTNSPVLAQKIKENKIAFVGAMHNLATGEIEFFDAKGVAL